MTGDWLSTLALKYLGNASRWPEIYDANQAVIEAAAREHPGPPVFGTSGHGHWIFPGTALAIPGASCAPATPSTPTTSTTPTADCSKKTFFLGVRGSGENPPADTSAFGLGREIHSVYTHLTALNPDVGVAGITYQAAPVPSVWDPIGLGAFTGSAIRGGNLLREAIERQAACHNQKIVLAGYSQGALAIHLALAQLPTKLRARISGIVLIGDPDASRDGLVGRLAIPPIPKELDSRTKS
ncbi:cutinase family protein [Streptomyces collinus]|uniref:cutinase family protein n=1 Tax=Streptomyces collinus TaxID=42684 RepID=UPI0033C31771